MLPPLLFHPIAKARSWAPADNDSHLARWRKPRVANARVGETWEVADLPDSIHDGQTRVAHGAFAGKSLREMRESHRDDLLGIATAAPDGAFPLLVKYLEAADNLSLQVHPTAEYVRTHPDTHLKTEAWIILDAKPGARVYRGIKTSTSADEFFRALADGTALEHVESYPVSRGDCIYLPSGTCHALGGGVFAAEVQTPSDTTFRVWDWDRNDPARPLHNEAARACMKFGNAQNDGTAGVVFRRDVAVEKANGIATRRLCRSKFFTVEWLDALETTDIPLYATGVPEVWMTVSGGTQWRSVNDLMFATDGATVLRPARVEPGSVRLTKGASVLRFTCASPLDCAI